jgi:two-component system chemotaxis response regulator CheB
MPEAAIKTGAVSRVLDLEAIGPFLAEQVAG